MTIADLLADSGLSTTDAEVLLAHAFGKNRTWIHAHAHDVIDDAAVEAFTKLSNRRKAGEPVAYIVGSKEFYGRNFLVGPGVLVPRPCTEELVHDALRFLDGGRSPSARRIDTDIVSCIGPLHDHGNIATVVDVGTGSGCIAITIACERPDVRCVALDVSPQALSYARQNAETHRVGDRVAVVESNLLENLRIEEPFLLVSNPPYVADKTLLQADVRSHEPSLALMGGGNDGGDFLRALMLQARNHPLCAGVVIECLESQASLV